MKAIFRIITTSILLIMTANGYADKFLHNFTLYPKDIAPYRNPTQRQIDFEKSDNIKNGLQYSGTPIKHWTFWNQIVDQEERGVFGYHAAKQKVRIFHDIITMVFQEILELETKRDFFFLRIPFDPLLNEHADANDFLTRYFPQVNDAIPEHRDQIVSLNYTLFGNYTNFSQCTVCYFSSNHSWFQIDYTKKLEFLFKELGIPTADINTLFEVGAAIERFETGVIYQFFDASHFQPHIKNAYDLVDSLCYPSLGAGGFDISVNSSLSDVFQTTYARRFDARTGQLRLVMNTAQTANPYGSVYIRRYDRIDAETTRNYEKNLREKIRKLPRDQEKIKRFKEKLKVYWNVNI